MATLTGETCFNQMLCAKITPVFSIASATSNYRRLKISEFI